MTGTCEISSAESYEYVFGTVVRSIVSKVASALCQPKYYFYRSINKHQLHYSAHFCDLNFTKNEVCFDSWYGVVFAGF